MDYLPPQMMEDNMKGELALLNREAHMQQALQAITGFAHHCGAGSHRHNRCFRGNEDFTENVVSYRKVVLKVCS